jgi:hypothetical protein
MERVVDLIDRQARLITGEKRLPADDYVYAKNEGENTYFYLNHTSNKFDFTLKARYPAIDNYYIYNKEDYTDGVIGIYLTNVGAGRERINLGGDIYGKYNPNDADPAESTITFYNIPRSIILDLGIEHSPYNPYDYYTEHPVDYHRDDVAGEDPS